MGYSLLVVEDHDDTRIALKKLLERQGYRVSTAATAKEALSALTREQIDVLLADIGLPDRSGIELMREARVLRPCLCGIAMTGHDEQQYSCACMEAGFAGFLQKPVPFDKLLTALKESCNRGP
jgi:DNA-binding NtrC family response regulator